jgi:hypothetical protein
MQFFKFFQFLQSGLLFLFQISQFCCCIVGGGRCLCCIGEGRCLCCIGVSKVGVCNVKVIFTSLRNEIRIVHEDVLSVSL